MLHVNNLSLEKVWAVVKQIKFQSSLGKSCGADGLYSNGIDIKSQLKEVEKKLNIKSADQKFENMTLETMESASRMFFYLNMCEVKDNDIRWLQSWFSFFNGLLKIQSADQIILTLNRILLATDFQKKHLKIAQKVLD